MLRICISLLLAFLLTSGDAFGGAKPVSAEERAAKIKPGQEVAVTLRSGKRLQGRMGRMAVAGFELKPVRAGKGDTQTLAFSEVESVKPAGRHAVKYVVIGVVVVGVVIGVLYAAAVGSLMRFN
jgi:hypothetical protein